MSEKNEYFPCDFIEHEQNSYSIISSNFHYFDDYFGEKGGGGYTLQKLAKKLVKENKIKGVKYDSEAGMFCAYSDTSENLLQLCNLLREITGDEKSHTPEEDIKPLIPLDQAEKLLLKGFVKNLDKIAQEDFLKNVPMPSLSKNQDIYLRNIQYGTDKEKIHSAKRINSEARTNTRWWENYLSHPNTITIILEAIDKEDNPKVYQELLGALVFICMRHLPDLRSQPYFLKALKSKVARNRELGLWGLKNIYDYPYEEILPLINDKSFLVRKAILSTISRQDYEFAPWMFDPLQSKVDKRPKDFFIFFSLFKDKNRKVQIEAMDVLKELTKAELFPELKELIPLYKELIKEEKDESSYYTGLCQSSIELLENID